MSRRAFAAWCAGFLAVCAVLGVLLKVTQRDDPRPEGVAERWLAALSDTTRKGVDGDAGKRLAELGTGDAVPSGGALAVERGFVSEAQHAEIVGAGKGLFTAIEVGEADGGRVPARVAIREGEVLRRTIVLDRSSGEWRVSGVVARAAGEVVLSEGGDPPSRASAPFWIGAVAIAAALTAGASFLVRLAGDRPRVP